MHVETTPGDSIAAGIRSGSSEASLPLIPAAGDRVHRPKADMTATVTATRVDERGVAAERGCTGHQRDGGLDPDIAESVNALRDWLQFRLQSATSAYGRHGVNHVLTSRARAGGTG